MPLQVVNFLVFRVFGPFAHFRVRYTTTSSMTYMFPPRHTAVGLIGAILGTPRHMLHKAFDNSVCQVGILLRQPLTTLIQSVKLLKIMANPKLPHFMAASDRIIVPHQLVRDPDYTFVFHHDDPAVMETLRQSLENHKCVYSPGLGPANLLCDFELVAERELEPLPLEYAGPAQTHSPAPTQGFTPEPQPTNQLTYETLATHLSADRTPSGYVDIVFDLKGHIIQGALTAADLPDEAHTHIWHHADDGGQTVPEVIFTY